MSDTTIEAPIDPAADPAHARRIARACAPLLVAGVLVVGIAFAFFWMFRQFQGYDDEGYLMVAVQHLLDGRRMYDEVVMVYGPGYFLYRWLLHGLLGLSITNDVVRCITLATWIACAVAYGAVAYRVVKRSKHAIPLAVLAACAAVYHLRVLAHEPGHPQELATLLVVLGLWAACLAFAARYRTLAFVVGALAGAVAMTKLNLGAFFAASCLLALVVDAPRRKAWGLGAMIAASIGAIALPYALLHARFEDSSAVNLCVVVTGALVACLPHAFRTRVDGRLRFSGLVWFTAGVALASAVSIGFILSRGSTLDAVYRCLVVSARKFATDFRFPMRCDWKALVVGFAWLAASLVAWARPKWFTGKGDWLALAGLKLSTGAYLLFFSVRDPELLVKYGGACAWLVLFDPERRATTEELFLRKFVCLVAVLQVLQVFPVPGSQVSIGTAPLLVIAVVCIADALDAIARLAPSPRAALVRTIAVAVASAGSIVWLGTALADVARQYGNRASADLRGSRLTHLPEWQATVNVWLADNLAASSDVFLSVQGQNSLYAWTGHKPASSVIVSTAWNLFDEAQQRELVETHRAHPDVMVVDNPEVFGPAKRLGIPFFAFVDRELAPLARVAQNTLMVKKERGRVPLVGCAWWVESDVDAVPAPIAERLARDPQSSALAMDVLPGRLDASVTRVDLVDVTRGKTIFASTGGADVEAKRLLQIIDASGGLLLPGLPNGVAPADWWRTDGLYVMVPKGSVPERTELLALRFYSLDGERELTLPVAQRARRR